MSPLLFSSSPGGGAQRAAQITVSLTRFYGCSPRCRFHSGPAQDHKEGDSSAVGRRRLGYSKALILKVSHQPFPYPANKRPFLPQPGLHSESKASLWRVVRCCLPQQGPTRISRADHREGLAGRLYGRSGEAESKKEKGFA